MGYATGMRTKRRKHEPQVGVATTTHERLKGLATDRKMLLGGLATLILEAYLKRLDAGEDWLEVAKAGKGGEQ